MPPILMPDDFKAYIKVKVDNQYFNKYVIIIPIVLFKLTLSLALFPNYRDVLPSHYKWKEYCPIVFKNLRERFGISYESYLVCLSTIFI